MKVWIVEQVDTSCTEARYIVWAEIFSTEEKAMAHLKSIIDEAVEEDGIIRRENLIVRNDGREVSDNDGRMYYKVSSREIDVVK